MAMKKSRLYASLWESCDELRGGMDATEYKNYVLTLLFVKYVSDRAASGETLLDVPEGTGFDALLKAKGKPDVGEQVDKALSALAEANDLQGVLDEASFNDPRKFGDGKKRQAPDYLDSNSSRLFTVSYPPTGRSLCRFSSSPR